MYQLSSGSGYKNAALAGWNTLFHTGLTENTGYSRATEGQMLGNVAVNSLQEKNPWAVGT